jgi:hypothetical protein
MDELRGKKTREQGKNPGEPDAKLFTKLPTNYLEMTNEEQEEWRHELARTILERFRKGEARP